MVKNVIQESQHYLFKFSKNCSWLSRFKPFLPKPSTCTLWLCYTKCLSQPSSGIPGFDQSPIINSHSQHNRIAILTACNYFRHLRDQEMIQSTWGWGSAVTLWRMWWNTLRLWCQQGVLEPLPQWIWRGLCIEKLLLKDRIPTSQVWKHDCSMQRYLCYPRHTDQHMQALALPTALLVSCLEKGVENSVSS